MTGPRTANRAGVGGESTERPSRPESFIVWPPGRRDGAPDGPKHVGGRHRGAPNERRIFMRTHRVAVGILATVALLLTGCAGASSSSPSASGKAATAKTAADLGGMDALVAAAKAEKTIN